MKRIDNFNFNLVLFRLMWIAGVVFCLSLTPIILAAYISSVSILLACSIAINAIVFLLASAIAVWLRIFEITNAFIMTPAEEQLSRAYQNRKLMDKELAYARQEFNRVIKG